MTALRWLWRHWHVPLVAVIGALGFVAALAFGSYTRPPSQRLRDELDAVDAGERARLDTVDKGRDQANALVEVQHRETLAKLDERQREKADRLRRDPAARARWLTRLGRGS